MTKTLVVAAHKARRRGDNDHRDSDSLLLSPWLIIMRRLNRTKRYNRFHIVEHHRLMYMHDFQQAGAQTAASNPDELQAFYADMQKREVERKKSKRMSHTGSIWSRKSVKRSAGQATAVATRASSSQPQQQQHQRPPASSSSVSLAKDTAVGAQPAGNSNDREMEKQDETRDVATPLTMSRSIIPDALNELPAWYSKDDSATYMMRYNLHNPVGPRRYYNHHLIPPSQKKPASRPPSIFSPSFPPMATSSQDSDDLTRLAGPSRTPSHSPLPTPSSSQVGVGDVGGVPRSRKTSQTAHDGVDLLDVSDPWGTNWHHQSPYDIGLTHNVVSVDPQEVRVFLSSACLRIYQFTVPEVPPYQRDYT